MPSNNLYDAIASKPSSPESQGYQGYTAQPNTESQQQGGDVNQAYQAQAASTSDPYEQLKRKKEQFSASQQQTAGQAQQAGAPPASYPSQGSSTPPSPVASNGTIPPQGSTPPIQFGQPGSFAPQQAQAQPQAQPAAGPDPFAAMGGGVQLAGGQWVPKNHPLAAGAAGAQPGAPGAVPGAAGPGGPTAPWGGQFGQQLSFPGQGQRPPIDLGNQQFSSYQGYDLQPQQMQQQALMQALLMNPDAMGPQMVGQLKGKMSDDALAMAQQQQQLQAQHAAARGVSGGGADLANQRRLDDTLRAQVLGGNRDIDLAAADANFKSRMGVAGLSDQLLNSQVGRGTSIAADQRAAQGMALQRALSQQGLQQQGYNTDLSAFLQGRGQDMDYANAGQNRDLQRYLGDQGFAMDRSRLTESGRQFDAGNQLGWAGLMNNMFQGNSQLGLSTAQLQQQAQNSLFNTIFGGNR